jgi:hypothetical protein
VVRASFNVDAAIPASTSTSSQRPTVRQGRRALRRASPAVEKRALSNYRILPLRLSLGPVRNTSVRSHIPVGGVSPSPNRLQSAGGSFRSPSRAGCPSRDVPLPTDPILPDRKPPQHRQMHVFAAAVRVNALRISAHRRVDPTSHTPPARFGGIVCRRWSDPITDAASQ